jgi:tetratricopeptide (TPR) repeat protein
MRRNEIKIDSLVTALGDLGLNRSRTSSIGNTPPVIGQTTTPPLTPISPSNSQPAEFIQGLFSASEEDQCVSGRPLSDASTLRVIDFTSDFEYEAIQQMRKTAFRSFVEKDYINAEPILQRILRKSEEKYLMDGFPWKDETILMLAKACWRISKFDDAGRLLEQRFEGRDRLMETLAKESLDLRKRSDAERILVQEFQGKEPVLDRLANSYLQDKKWKEAKSAFLDLMRYSADDNVRLQRMHTLAKICFALKQYKAAEEWCLLAVKGRQTTLGKRHHQFYDSVNLLTQICKAKGDHVEAKAYMAVLRDLPPGLQGNPPPNSQ